MSITDELRKWLKSLYTPNSATVKDEGERIADRIDAEHEESIQREHESAYDAGYADGMGVANKADMRAKYLRGKNDGYDEGWDAAAKTMTEHMVELPKDADGEYIHVGDEMCGYGWPNGGVYCRAIVNEVTILVGPQDGAYRGWLMWAANECRHYHAPTVEDVLREFADEVYADADNEIRDRDFLCAKYAKRLTLAEGEDA